MTAKVEIAIVGGGIIGSSTAYYVTRHAAFQAGRVAVTLIEESEIAMGASGKAGGLVALDWHGPTTASLAALSHRLHNELASEHGGEERWGFRRLDTLSIEADLTGKSASSRAKKFQAASQFSWLDPKILVDSSRIGRPETTCQVHPQQFTRSMADLAVSAGAKRIKAKVTGLKRDAEKGKIVLALRSEEGLTFHEADKIVFATGPWTGSLLKGLGINGRGASSITGSRAHSVVLAPDASRPLPAQCLFTNIKDKTSSFVAPEVYNRPDGTAYICGPTDNSKLPISVDAVTADPKAISELLEQAQSISPSHLSLSTSTGDKGARLLAEQACYLPVGTPTGDPVIGELDSGIYVASGHSCWGISNGPGTGCVVAELLLDGEVTSADISSLEP